MWIALIGFLLLLGWGLYNGDVYPREGAILVMLWLVTLVIFLVAKWALLWFIVPGGLLSLYLLLKIMGQDIHIR